MTRYPTNKANMCVQGDVEKIEFGQTERKTSAIIYL